MSFISLVVGFGIGVLFAILVSRLGKLETSRRKQGVSTAFYLSVPFLLALVLTLIFFGLTFVIESIWIREKSPSLSTFLLDAYTWYSASKELFFASFIALFIIATIEVSSRSELKEEFNAMQDAQKQQFEEVLKRQAQDSEQSRRETEQAIIAAVYQERVPKKVFQEIERYILGTKFVRESHAKSMILNPIEGSSNHVLMTAKQRFRVRNTSAVPEISVQNLHLPLSNNPYSDLTKITSFRVRNIEGDNEIPDVYPFTSETKENEDELKSQMELSPSGAEAVYKFPPIKVSGGGCLEIDVEMQIAKDLSDNEILTFLSPTLSGSLSVRSNVPDLEIKAISLHRGTLTESIETTETFKRWTFDRPILPHQGYVVMWSKRLKVGGNSNKRKASR